MLKVGASVTYRDRSNRKKVGIIDKVSNATGDTLYRVDDKWFLREGLTAQ